MSVDPNIDYTSHDPEDGEQLSDDPRIREVQEFEARMRRALATKENPLRDTETSAERMARIDREHAARQSREGDASQDDSAS